MLLLPFIFFIFCFIPRIDSKEYFVWLQSTPSSSHPQQQQQQQQITDGISGKDYLKNHILTMETFLPSFKLIQRYNNLVLYGFLVYSASIDEINDWEQFISLAKNDIKLVEEIHSNFHIAQSPLKTYPVDFVPYVPPPKNAITVSSDENSLCTIPYDFLQRTLKNESTLHKMDVYVLDTGIQSTHDSLKGRVTHGFDAISPSSPLRSDPHGHGTQVAGIIGGKGFGVNPLVNLIDVRVVNANGFARADHIIAGLDFAVGNHMRQYTSNATSSIINLSLSGPRSQILDFALFLTSKVMLVIASNGDENAFSCWKSPSSSDFIVSVGGISSDTDTQLHESNYGDCVDILAPGENIPAPYIGISNHEMKTLSGTSAAAAVVTGIATRLMGIIHHNETIAEALMTAHTDNTVSQFIKTILTSSKYSLSSQMNTVHLNLFLACDFTTTESIDEIFVKELKLGPRKKSIPALNRAKKTFLELQNKKKAAMFEPEEIPILESS